MDVLDNDKKNDKEPKRLIYWYVFKNCFFKKETLLSTLQNVKLASSGNYFLSKMLHVYTGGGGIRYLLKWSLLSDAWRFCEINYFEYS